MQIDLTIAEITALIAYRSSALLSGGISLAETNADPLLTKLFDARLRADAAQPVAAPVVNATYEIRAVEGLNIKKVDAAWNTVVRLYSLSPDEQKEALMMTAESWHILIHSANRQDWQNAAAVLEAVINF